MKEGKKGYFVNCYKKYVLQLTLLNGCISMKVIEIRKRPQKQFSNKTPNMKKDI
jgi:hypothetical protein